MTTNTTPTTGYRITTPEGWVIEAKDELAHRRVLSALASLSDVLGRAAVLPPGALIPVPDPVPRVPQGLTFPSDANPSRRRVPCGISHPCKAKRSASSGTMSSVPRTDRQMRTRPTTDAV
ncbi:hypothetical protein FIV34_11935 [Luteibacter pinisoli]|uniref:Uncharacterized protein n=1 Tax=Luteibacter pinisoli TaxID=2589080 RepID=A0A4Y5Z3A5_9GAMM|nr:hypothetical protein [Luteibacter pinisoli]QDE39870.1 hypothetical protein FIV34_11935 [Luteibacter pinisoli]